MPDYIAEYTIAVQDLCEDKNPPLCDSCSEPLPENDDENSKSFTVHGLVLDYGNDEGYSLWGLLCLDCCRKYHKKLPIVPEKDLNPDVKSTLHDVLGREMQLTFGDTWEQAFFGT